MLLAHTNTGGGLSSQVFKENVGLNKPGVLEYGVYRASYGSIMDGVEVDMIANLETEEKLGAFESDFSVKIRSLRYNTASLFKNCAIHGQFGVIHQIRASITAPNKAAGYNPQPNVFTPVNGVPFTIKTPINVFASDFKRGKYFIKTKAVDYAGAADVSELYMILDNQPGWLSAIPVGTTVSAWADGQFLEVQGNREVALNSPVFASSNWTPNGITVSTGPFAGTYDKFNGTGVYTSGDNAVVGFMEGLADMFPWYTDPANPEVRLGLDRAYRDQPNRLMYSTEQAGGWVVQQEGEHIIDAIMRGSFLTKATVPYADIGIWINPATRARMGYEEGDAVKPLRDNFVAGPIIYQRGVKTTDYQIGNQVVREVIDDMNLPTDVIVIGPQTGISYNCWDNSYLQIDNFIKETWGKAPPPSFKDMVEAIPDEFTTRLDLGDRVIYGSPSMSDGNTASFNYGSRIRHPRNTLPIAYQEMGALFTETPYCYTIVKLRDVETDITST
jgi:hypothetical protein